MTPVLVPAILLVSPVDFFQNGGPIMWPLLLLSIAAIAVIIERFIAYRQYADTAPDLLPEVLKLARAGRYDDAAKLAEGREGPVAKSLAVILRNRNQSTPVVEGLVNETGNEYFIRLERLLPVLDTTTTLSPLLGLLGTILGMVRVFQQFTQAGNSDAARGQILGGVGEALYATAFGIAIALVCFAFYNYFAARQRAAVAETEQAATKLINVLGENANNVTGATVARPLSAR